MEELKAATEMAEHLQNSVFPDLRVGLLHGQMKSIEKQEVMAKFNDKHIDILVSTTVIEVGIDVPNATLMVIENAETVWIVSAAPIAWTCRNVASTNRRATLVAIPKGDRFLPTDSSDDSDK